MRHAVKAWMVGLIIAGSSILVGLVRLSPNAVADAVAKHDAVPFGQTTSCEVAPRESASVRSLLATPSLDHHLVDEGEPVQPMGSPRLIGTAPEPGIPADETIVAIARQVIERFVACQNGGNVGSMLALVSDDFVRQAFAMGSDQAAIDAYLTATPRPRPPTEQITIVDVRNARVLADGRITLDVDVIDPARRANGRPLTDRFTLVEADGGWLIDSVVAGTASEPQSAGDNATPGSR